VEVIKYGEASFKKHEVVTVGETGL